MTNVNLQSQLRIPKELWVTRLQLISIRSPSEIWVDQGRIWLIFLRKYREQYLESLKELVTEQVTQCQRVKIKRSKNLNQPKSITPESSKKLYCSSSFNDITFNMYSVKSDYLSILVGKCIFIQSKASIYPSTALWIAPWRPEIV